MMTTEEFMEFYGGTRYLHSSDRRALLNTDLIFDEYSYRSNIFQIALQHTVHDVASDMITTQVYIDVLQSQFNCVAETDAKVLEVLDIPVEKWDFGDVKDEYIWRGRDTFPGLYSLTHARCLCFLIADGEDSDKTRLSTEPHPDVHAPENLRFEIPAPWFFRAAVRLRSESKLHFNATAILIHYYDDANVTHEWIAEALGIEIEVLGKIFSTAATIIEECLMDEVRTLQRRSEGIASLWSRYSETFA